MQAHSYAIFSGPLRMCLETTLSTHILVVLSARDSPFLLANIGRVEGVFTHWHSPWI